MFRHIFFILLVFSLTACASSSMTMTPTVSATKTVPVTPALQILFPSDWAGAITHADGTVESIRAQFTESGGILNIEPFTKTYEIKELQHRDSNISFTITNKNVWKFSGEFADSQITGQIEANGQKDSFQLLPLITVSKAALNVFPGTYQFESGESLLINLAPEYSSSGLYFFGQGLMLTHFGTGAIRALYPVDNDTFLVGAARAVGYPFAEQVTFLRDTNGNVTGLTWQTRGAESGELSEAKQATRLLLKSEVVHFTSEDGTRLTGLLTVPATTGSYPAIMMLHGSEPGTKDNFGNQQMSAFMASQGIAILTYDKRGVGGSGGHYSESASETNLSLTARDAIAGVEYLKSRPEIKGDKIGLTGFSQAGWVIPLAASQSKDISYFIILSGPVTSVRHENLYSSYTNNGNSPSSLSEAEIAKRLADASHSGFDSTPIIGTLDQRGLWIFGDQDKSVPVLESVSNLRAIITQGKSNFTYVILEDADHNLQQTTQGLFNEIPYSSGFQGDYYKTMTQWLVESVK